MRDILISRAAGVVEVTLNRPHCINALTEDMWHELHDILAQAEQDTAVRVLILSGAGGNFCSGSDLRSGQRSREHPMRRMRRANAAVSRLHALPMPTIAKVRGAAVGGGASLALACDFVLASPDAYFCQIFIDRGMSPDTGSSWILPRLIGLQQAKRLAYFGTRLSAAQAREAGLVTLVESDEQLDRRAAEWAADLAQRAPVALAMTKSLLNNSFESTFGEALAAESAAQSVNQLSDDGREAVAAFTEGRRPRFTGR
jgi:2-(1,2-epoxy-1,2-dihydrophenyl)acetyl-CoA isomerase